MSGFSQIDWSILQNGVLTVLSLSACLYCAILNTRLKRLNSLKTGLGGSLMSLTKALESIQKTSQITRNQIQAELSRMDMLLEKSEQCRAHLEAKIIESDKSVDRVNGIIDPLNQSIERARTSIIALYKLHQRADAILPDENKTKFELSSRRTDLAS